MTAAAAGLVLGFAGSLHCVAMCGPLVLIGAGRTFRSATAYHAGRIAVYAAFGVSAGAAGHVLNAGGLQQIITIAAGIILLISAAGLLKFGSPATDRLAHAINRSVIRLNRWRPKTGPLSYLLAGGVNGLLPCGLVYAALVAAAGLGNMVEGIVFMIAFGLGSIPALSALSHAAQFTRRLPAFATRRIVPIAIGFVGAMLIVRATGTLASGTSHQHIHVATVEATVR